MPGMKPHNCGMKSASTAVLPCGRGWPSSPLVGIDLRAQVMDNLVGAFLAGTVFLIFVALAIYVVVSNSELLTIVGVCAIAGGLAGYVRARLVGRRYAERI